MSGWILAGMTIAVLVHAAFLVRAKLGRRAELRLQTEQRVRHLTELFIRWEFWVSLFSGIAPLVAANVMVRMGHPVVGMWVALVGWACWIFGTRLAMAKLRKRALGEPHGR